MRARIPEASVLRACLDLLAVHPRVAWAQRMNTGSMRIEGRTVRFGFVGCSDIIGQLKDGRFLAIECKASDGKATLPQAQFIATVRAHNGLAGVVTSIDELLAILT